MLSVPTLWTVFVVNFLALGMIWAYVARSYPKLEAARFWTASAFVAAFGATVATLRFEVGTLLPLLGGGTAMIFAACLAAMGIRRFYHQPVSWRSAFLITGLSLAGVSFFIVVYDSMPMRMLIYSIGQSLPLLLTLKLLLSRQDGNVNSGARLAGIVSVLIIALYTIRGGGTFFQIGDFLFPNNLPANAHGNGYADPNVLISNGIASVEADGGAFNVREGNHAVNLSLIHI